MKKKDTEFVLFSFLGWRALIILFVFLGIALFPLQNNFLGGGLTNYLKNPYFWSWLNFDGEHYAAIAYQGYLPLTYFFFPLYPLLVRLFAGLTGGGYTGVAISGLIISNLSFIFAVWGIWKLIKLDYKEKVARGAIILLLLFPTSFFFGSFYTESLTLALIVWSFYFARKKSWILAGVLGAFATATRITAIALLPAIAVEIWQSGNFQKTLKVEPLKLFSLVLIPVGLVVYMYYLYRVTGDPLEFVHNVSIFGQQRSSQLVILPQVFYRYIFKVLPNLNYNYFPVVFSTLLEVVTAILFLGLSIWSFFKLRPSYSLFLATGYLIPPLSGSFSSFPRYVLILFPAFILGAIWLNKKSRLVRLFIFSLLLLLLGVACSLFSRGYWVS